MSAFESSRVKVPWIILDKYYQLERERTIWWFKIASYFVPIENLMLTSILQHLFSLSGSILEIFTMAT